MKTAIPLSLIAGVLIGAALVWVGRGAPPPAPSADRAVAPRPASPDPMGSSARAALEPQVEQALRALAARLDGLNAQVQELHQARPQSAPGEAREPSPTLDGESFARRLELEAVLQAARGAQYQAEFQAESFDANRTSETRERIAGLMQENDLPPDLMKELECRGERCRVELAHDERGEVESWIPFLLADVADLLPTATSSLVDYPDGSRGTILYLGAAESASLGRTSGLFGGTSEKTFKTQAE